MQNRQMHTWLIQLRFYVPVDTKQVIQKMLFTTNLLASTEKTKQQSNG